LLRRLDVAREENHATERELFRQRTHLGSDHRPGEAPDQKLTDVSAKRTWHDNIIELCVKPNMTGSTSPSSIIRR
jgi:hypothetical protein